MQTNKEGNRHQLMESFVHKVQDIEFGKSVLKRLDLMCCHLLGASPSKITESVAALGSRTYDYMVKRKLTGLWKKKDFGASSYNLMLQLSLLQIAVSPHNKK